MFFVSMINSFYVNQRICLQNNHCRHHHHNFVENLVAIMKFSFFYGVLHTFIFVNSLKIQYVKEIVRRLNLYCVKHSQR